MSFNLSDNYFNDRAPRTQYNRNLTFRLTGGGSTVVFTFPIKPGEFTSDTPARVTTTQTLQGVYQDFGGLGIQTLRYQGNTGWRQTRNGADNSDMDGFQCFKMLYNDVYREYHNRISASTDPNDIELLLIDDLYEVTYRVSIDDFQATKSKSSPLLYNYAISMTVQSTDTNTRDAKDLTKLPSVALDASYIPLSMSDYLNDCATYDNSLYRLYTVQSGDSLQSISFLYFGTKDRAMSIANLNRIAPPYIFNAGTILMIPW